MTMGKINVRTLGLKFRYLDEEKKEFLQNIADNKPETTFNVYLSVLSKVVEDAERVNGRVWADFSETMVDMAFLSLKATSEATLLSYLSVINDYLAATTDEGDTLRMGYGYTINLTRKNIKKFINRSCEKYRYITPKEFDEIIESEYVDAEAKALAILLYNGVKGTSFKDIIDINVDDINLETGEIFKNGKLLVKLDQKYMKYFEEAINKTEFVVYDVRHNDKMTKTMMSYEDYENRGLKKCFIRRFVHPSFDWTPAADQAVIAKRIKDVCKGIENEHLDAQSLYNSGMAYRLLEYCNMELPDHKRWREFREATGSKISQMTAESACRIILDKINKGE